MSPFSHCHFCGSAYSPERVQSNRRDCDSCGNVNWHNPTPISVILQPVYRIVPDRGYSKFEYGLLAGRRTIEPKKGLFSLPGGFVDMLDIGYEEASLRELGEEIRFSEDPSWPRNQRNPSLLFSLPGDPGQIIAFCQAYWAIPEFWIDSFLPSSECDRVKVLWEPEELCFRSHTKAVDRWFSTGSIPEKLCRAEATKRFYVVQREIQNQCQHEWVDAPELYNYHKREEFSRCVKCELVR